MKREINRRLTYVCRCDERDWKVGKRKNIKKRRREGEFLDRESVQRWARAAGDASTLRTTARVPFIRCESYRPHKEEGLCRSTVSYVFVDHVRDDLFGQGYLTCMWNAVS